MDDDDEFISLDEINERGNFHCNVVEVCEDPGCTCCRTDPTSLCLTSWSSREMAESQMRWLKANYPTRNFELVWRN